jgi:hypothetical protein
MDSNLTGPVLVGLNAMGTAFRRSRWTIRRWIDTEDFPAAQLPNGEWTTTLSLIDGWVLARARKSNSGEGAGILGNIEDQGENAA